MTNVTTLNFENTKSPVRIFLLGTMRAFNPAGENILPRAKKTQAVLAYLCLSGEEQLPRSRVAGMIWDRSSEAQARDSLRHAVSELDKNPYWRIEADHGTIRLNLAGCWIDAFESPERSDLLLDNLYGVSSSFDQWLMGERIRFEDRWQATLEKEFNELCTGGALPELRAAAARKLLNFIPTHEPAVRGLMSAFVDMEDRAQAIREYERFRTVVQTSLGMPPSEGTVNLYEAIRLDSRVKARSAIPPERESREQRNDLAAQALSVVPQTEVAPSIAVLPFRNISGDPQHDHVADGLTEDLIETLSRIQGLFVISRLSAASFKNQDRTPIEIGAALGVRYIISGSVRISNDRLRLVVELAEADTAKVLRVSRFDEKFSDLLEIQDNLAEAVVHAVAPHLRFAEFNRVRVKRPENYSAYELFLRGQENMLSSTRSVFESSERLFEAAIAREPRYAAALAWLAYWHVMLVGQGWSRDRAVDALAAERLAQQAIDCDPTESMAFAVRGHAAAYLRKDFDFAFGCFEAALQINPNSARAWLWNASTHGWNSDGPNAVEKITRAMALSPYDPLMCSYSGSASLAYLADGQYSRSIEFGLRCIRENRSYSAAYKTLIPALMLAGRESEARTAVNQLLVLEPGFTVERFRTRFPGGSTHIGMLCCDALRNAGAPIAD